jgi:hypothetical protein
LAIANTSPLGATAMRRTLVTPRAHTPAQNPCGSVRPALSASHPEGPVAGMPGDGATGAAGGALIVTCAGGGVGDGGNPIGGGGPPQDVTTNAATTAETST